MLSFNVQKDSPNAIGKAMEILTLLTESHCELGTSEIALRLGFNKATTSRTLQTLCNYGYIVHNHISKKYRLGPLAYKMSMNIYVQNFHHIIGIARGYSEQLCAKINETVSFEVWCGESTVASYIAECQHKLRAVPNAGNQSKDITVDVLPNHAAAGAKSILAFKSIEESNQLLQRHPLIKYTANTLTDANEIQARLKQFNQQGYATDKEEMYEGICAIGVPIFDQFNRPVAALVPVIPTVRFTRENEQRIVQETKASARMIMKKMNCK